MSDVDVRQVLKDLLDSRMEKFGLGNKQLALSARLSESMVSAVRLKKCGISVENAVSLLEQLEVDLLGFLVSAGSGRGAHAGTGVDWAPIVGACGFALEGLPGFCGVRLWKRRRGALACVREVFRSGLREGRWEDVAALTVVGDLLTPLVGNGDRVLVLLGAGAELAVNDLAVVDLGGRAGVALVRWQEGAVALALNGAAGVCLGARFPEWRLVGRAVGVVRVF
jgi:hypothetical protein